MTDSVHVEHQVARLARVRDQELTGLESSTAARKLLASLVAEQVHRHDPASRRRQGGRQARRLAVAAAAVIAMTVTAVVVPSLLGGETGRATSYANSAIEVSLENGFFVGRIKDPLADHAKYVEAFQAVGKDVDIELVPVSPKLVGRLLETGGGGSFGRVFTDLVSSGPERVDCALTPASCTMVVRVSADTTGSVRYRIGRAAQPGETSQDPVVGADVPPAPSPPGGGSGN